jgi:[acyl-carrier-protein] S-malonyltransferase
MPKIAFLFPGQGAQTVGMGKQLYDSLPAARQLFDEAGEVLGYSLADVCFQGPAERLNTTAVSQPAIFVVSLAALESLRASEPAVIETCQAAAGLSLGEYTALVFSGVLSFKDGLRVVKQRGEAMQAAADATPSGMVSIIGLERDKVEELCAKARCAGVLEIANLLSPGNIVVSGTKEACAAAEKIVEEMGGRSVRLTVAGAFHTALMKPADDRPTTCSPAPWRECRSPAAGCRSGRMSMPSRTWTATTSASCWCGKCCSPCSGNKRCATCWQQVATSFTRLARSGSSTAC